MKVLFIDMPAFGKEDMIEAFSDSGITVILFAHEALPARVSQAFTSDFCEKAKQVQPDFVFSFNYFPIVSRCCSLCQLPYISYVYDSPLLSLFSCTVINPCNYIFLFDRAFYERLHQDGISTVYYLPLAANTRRLEQIAPAKKEASAFQSDVAFVGALYNESHHLFERLEQIQPYTKGYLQSIMKAQLQIQGYYFIEELLSPVILKDLQKACPYQPNADGTEPDSYVYANYFIARKLAEMERKQLLKALSRHHTCRLYTHQPTPDLPDVLNMGPIDPYTSLPFICKCSKINLNITLRSIQSGIPMRSFDILGAGGFLLSNYQRDYEDYFTAGEDYDYYISEEDLLEKTDYYLSHEKERLEIAENGHRKVQKFHTFKHRIHYMMQTAGITRKEA